MSAPNPNPSPSPSPSPSPNPSPNPNLACKVADFSGPRTYENIVQWVETHRESTGGTQIPKAKVEQPAKA